MNELKKYLPIDLAKIAYFYYENDGDRLYEELEKSYSEDKLEIIMKKILLESFDYIYSDNFAWNKVPARA